MNIIKNLSKTIVNKGIGFNLREDLNFSDDGNYFRGFDYKGLPITTLRADNKTYLCVRVDYLPTTFTYREWMETEEWSLADEFNGVDEIDLDKLIENCERIIAKVAEMNEIADKEVIDMTDVKRKVVGHLIRIGKALHNIESIKWWEKADWELVSLKRNREELIKTSEYLKELDFDAMDNKNKKLWNEKTTFPGEYTLARVSQLCGKRF